MDVFYIEIGAASVARAWSGYVDSLAGGSISNYTRRIMHGYTMAEPLGTIPDFLAAGLCLAYAMLLALGVKCSATVNSFLTTINLGVMGLVIGLGIYYAKFSNWSCDFMPFGFSGVLTGISEFIDFRPNLNHEISNHPSTSLSSFINRCCNMFLRFRGLRLDRHFRRRSTRSWI